jgi:hypothetical protein
MRTIATDWTHCATLCQSIGWDANDVWSLVCSEQDGRDAIEREHDEELLAEKQAEKQAVQDAWTQEDSKALEAAFGFDARAEEAEQAWVDTLP